MRKLRKHPMLVLAVGILGISVSSIFVRYSDAPSAVTAAFRLLWTVALLTPMVLGHRPTRQELLAVAPREVLLSCLSGVFLAVHVVLWFESLRHPSVASSTTIVCTEVIWVSLGFCLFMKGKISLKAAVCIGVTLFGSLLVAFADSGSGRRLYGDILSLLAAMAVAAYTLLGRAVRSRVSTAVYTWMVYTACAAVLTVTCLVQGHDLLESGLRPVAVGFALAVFSTILGHSIFSWCLKYFSPAFVAASKLCEPVGAGLLAVLLFAEIPTGLQLLGSALILGGVFAYSRLEKTE